MVSPSKTVPTCPEKPARTQNWPKMYRSTTLTMSIGASCSQACHTLASGLLAGLQSEADSIAHKLQGLTETMQRWQRRLPSRMSACVTHGGLITLHNNALRRRVSPLNIPRETGSVPPDGPMQPLTRLLQAGAGARPERLLFRRGAGHAGGPGGQAGRLPSHLLTLRRYEPFEFLLLTFSDRFSNKAKAFRKGVGLKAAGLFHHGTDPLSCSESEMSRPFHFILH